MEDHERNAVATADDDPRRPAPPALRRLLAGISAVERAAGALILLVLLVLVLMQTGMRFLPIGGWVWTGELARFCLVWLTFSLSGYLMGRDGHITLELVDHVAGGRLRWPVRAFANLVTAVVCLGFVVEAVAMVTNEGGQSSPAMGLPLRLVYVIPLLGFALTALRAGCALVWRPPAAPLAGGALGPVGGGDAVAGPGSGPDTGSGAGSAGGTRTGGGTPPAVPGGAAS